MMSVMFLFGEALLWIQILSHFMSLVSFFTHFPKGIRNGLIDYKLIRTFSIWYNFERFPDQNALSDCLPWLEDTALLRRSRDLRVEK